MDLRKRNETGGEKEERSDEAQSEVAEIAEPEAEERRRVRNSDGEEDVRSDDEW